MTRVEKKWCALAIAAVANHRRFIGIEIDRKYFEIAKERISRVQ